MQQNYSLLQHNTFGMNVRADYFVEYDSVEKLTEFLQTDLAKTEQLLPIGEGSNLLFVGDFRGVILHSKIRFTEIVRHNDSHAWVRAGSGVVWDNFCAEMVAQNLAGSENLSYIPGTVGASAVQNIGAYGVEVADLIDTVETIEIATGKPRIFTNNECRYGYRDSIFKGELKGKFIVTAVIYKLDKQPIFHLDYGNLRAALADTKPTLASVRQAIIDIRKAKLPEPNELGSAGSFFKNPVVPQAKCNELLATYATMPHYNNPNDTAKIPAAWLIEQCGWKGKTLGGAAVYDKQPLVIVNRNHATPDDVVRLSEAIVKSVTEKFGVKIEPEVNLI